MAYKLISPFVSDLSGVLLFQPDHMVTSRIIRVISVHIIGEPLLELGKIVSVHCIITLKCVSAGRSTTEVSKTSLFAISTKKGFQHNR